MLIQQTVIVFIYLFKVFVLNTGMEVSWEGKVHT